ncbi:hypothetical protein ACHAWF_011993 [Thalassiosira exigua]
MANFISKRADMVNYPWFFTLQGNCMKSIVRQLGVTPKYYAAWLLAANFVFCRKLGSGEFKVCWRNDAFQDEFMNNLEFGLRGPSAKPNNGPSEYSSVQVLVEALKDHDNVVPDPSGPKIDLYVLRIGRYGDEVIEDPAGEINRGIRPPPFDDKMRRLQRAFHLEMRHVVSLFLNDERLPVVTKWVEVPQLKEKPRPRGPKLPSPMKPVPTTPARAQHADMGAAVTPSPDKDEALKTPEDDESISDDDSYGGGFDGDEDLVDEDEEGGVEAEGKSKDFPLLSHLHNNLPLFADTKFSGFDLGKVSRSNLLREVVALCDKFDEPLQFESDNSRFVSRLLNVPEFSSNEGLYTGVDRLMRQLFEEAGPDKTVRTILSYFKTKCNKTLLEELASLRLVPRLMDEYDIAALMIHSNIQITHWEKVVQALKLFMGIDKIAVGKAKWRDLGTGHGKVYHDKYVYKKPVLGSKKGKKGTVKKELDEHISYWWKDPVDEFERNLTKMMNANSIHPDRIEFVHVVNGGDHGKNKFRFTVKVIVKADGKYHHIIYPLADIKCKKDHADVIKNTILPKISDRVNSVATDKIHFYCDGDVWSCTSKKIADRESDHDIQPTSFLCGDLAFLCMVMGKAGYEKDWCYLCKLMAPEWQQAGAKGDDWTIEDLIAKFDANEQSKAKGKSMGGVKDKPYFDKILVRNVIWSVLHAMMGLGNDGVEFITDFGESFVEDLPEEEVGMKNMIIFLEQKLAEARADRDAWKKTTEGKELSGLPGKIERLQASLERGRFKTYTEIQAAKAREGVLIARRDELNAVLAFYVEEVNALVAEITENKKAVEKFRVNRKSDDVSLYCDIDDILKRYGIHRSAYHGGQINGIGIKLLMDNAAGIMAEIKTLFISKLTVDSRAGADKIEKFCSDMTRYFTLWDDAFSMMHTVDPVEEDFVKTQATIDLAMECMRNLGMSITPKAHGAEAHVVNQMRTTPGGISMMIEHWVERYHQVGFKYDDQWRLLKSEERKATLRSHREHIAAHTEVTKRLRLLDEKYRSQGKREATIEKETARKDAKRPTFRVAVPVPAARIVGVETVRSSEVRLRLGPSRCRVCSFPLAVPSPPIRPASRAPSVCPAPICPTLPPSAPRCCTALGEYAVDLSLLAEAGLLDRLAATSSGESEDFLADFHPRIDFSKPTLNDFMSRPKPIWIAVRNRLVSLFLAKSSDDCVRDDRLERDLPLRNRALRPLSEARCHLPARIGDYTDFTAPESTRRTWESCFGGRRTRCSRIGCGC